jgi:hypothetical protein
MTAKAPERVVHLALSQRAAKLLDQMIEAMDGYIEAEDDSIAAAIRADLKEQIEVKKPRNRK